MALTLATAARNAACNGVVDLIDAGTGTATGILKIGTAAMASTLAQLAFANPAFGNANTGVATANAIASDTDADNTGTAAAAVIVDRDNATIISGITVGTGSEMIVLNTTSIVQHGTVAITALTVTQPAS